MNTRIKDYIVELVPDLMITTVAPRSEPRRAIPVACETRATRRRVREGASSPPCDGPFRIFEAPQKYNFIDQARL